MTQNPLQPESRHRRESSGSEWSFIQQILVSIPSELKRVSLVLGEFSRQLPFPLQTHSPPSPSGSSSRRPPGVGSIRLQWPLVFGWSWPTGGPGGRSGGGGKVESGASSSGFLRHCPPPTARVVTSLLHDWQSLLLPKGLIQHSSHLYGFPNDPSLPLSLQA